MPSTAARNQKAEGSGVVETEGVPSISNWAASENAPKGPLLSLKAIDRLPFIPPTSHTRLLVASAGESKIQYCTPEVRSMVEPTEITLGPPPSDGALMPDASWAILRPRQSARVGVQINVKSRVVRLGKCLYLGLRQQIIGGRREGRG